MGIWAQIHYVSHLKAGRLSVDEHCLDRLHGFQGLRPLQLPCSFDEFGRLPEILGGVLLCLGVHALELVTGPLEGVLNGVGKVLQCADGDGLLRGVARRAVGLCHVGKDNLGVSFSAQSSGLQEWLLVVDTTPVHVHSSVDVVQSVDDSVQLLEKVVGENVFCIGTNSILSKNKVICKVMFLFARSLNKMLRIKRMSKNLQKKLPLRGCL